MALGAPEIIVILMFFGIYAIFPVWGYVAGSKRSIGAAGGLLLGFFLSLLGIIIVYCTRRTDYPANPFSTLSNADELAKYKRLLDSGAITDAEYQLQKEKLLHR